MAVDLYSGLKGHRLLPSSVTISPISLRTREKSDVFWRRKDGHSCKDSKNRLLSWLSWLLTACADLNKDLILLNRTSCYCDKSEERVRTGWTHSKRRDDVCTFDCVWAKDPDKKDIWRELRLDALRLCLYRGIKVKCKSANHFKGQLSQNQLVYAKYTILKLQS